MVFEKHDGSFPCQLSLSFIVTAGGIVVEAVVCFGIHVHGVIHVGGFHGRPRRFQACLRLWWESPDNLGLRHGHGVMQ